jgi:hypothetical protein
MIQEDTTLCPEPCALFSMILGKKCLIGSIFLNRSRQQDPFSKTQEKKNILTYRNN